MSYDREQAELVDVQDTQLPLVTKLNKFVQHIVGAAAWLNFVLIFLILTTVILRYGFHRNGLLLNWPLVPMEELQWHLYSVPFMFGLAYAITNDSHIRIDIVRIRISKQSQYIFEIFGILFLLLPFVIILFYFGIDYTTYAFINKETSQSTMGLPYRWIVKSVIPISMLLIIIASLARLMQEVALLRHLIKNNNHKDKEKEREGR